MGLGNKYFTEAEPKVGNNRDVGHPHAPAHKVTRCSNSSRRLFKMSIIYPSIKNFMYQLMKVFRKFVSSNACTVNLAI